MRDTMPDFVTRSQFAGLESRVDSLEDQMDAIRQVRSDTEELLQAFQDVQAGFRVLGWLGKAARPIAWLVGAAVAIAAALGVGK